MQNFSSLPTVFHITHWKAGSQWVSAVLKAFAEERMITPKVKSAHFLEDAIVPGMIYPTVYVSREQFESVHVPENHIKFIVIRDLRDTIVSHYFSLTVSHAVITDTIARSRARLSDLSLEEGILHAIKTVGKQSAEIQSSWVNSGELFIKYENLVANEYEAFKQIADYCQIEVEENYFHHVIFYNSFEARSGRQKGEEDVQSHFRKGIVGDWRNYFTDKIKADFKQRYGDILIATGYEKDYDW